MSEEGGNSDRVYNEVTVHMEGKIIVNLIITSFLSVSVEFS